MGSGESPARTRRQITRARSPLLVIGIDTGAGAGANLAWDVLTRVEPRLRHLIYLTDPRIPMPGMQRAAPDAAGAPASGRGLAAALDDADRIALLAPLHSGHGTGSVLSWHHEIDRSTPRDGTIERPRLSKLSFLAPARHLGLYHLPLWLEDEMPIGGVDFIGMSVPASATPEAAAALTRQLPLIVSAVTGLLWRILRDAAEPPETLLRAA